MTQQNCEVCAGGEFRHLYTKDAHHFFRCRSCGLIRINPQPTDAVLAGIYGTRYYDAWGVQNEAQRVFDLKKRTFRQHVFSAISLPNGSRVLDCGAAFGALMDAAKELGWQPYGIELADEAATEIARCFGAGHVYSGPFEQAAFPGLGEASFDAVFMCDFTEHVREPRVVLQKAISLLRAGGFLVITTPDGGSTSCRLMGHLWPHTKVEHLYFFNRANLSQLLDQLGVTVTRADRAWKSLDLEYLRHQFNTYPRRLVTGTINCLSRLAGRRLSRHPLSFSFGEMIVVGTKR